MMDEDWARNFEKLTQVVTDFQRLKTAKLPEAIKPEFDRIVAVVQDHMDKLAEAFGNDSIPAMGFHSGAITALLDHAFWIVQRYEEGQR